MKSQEERERLAAEIEAEIERIKACNMELKERILKLEADFRKTKSDMEAKVAELQARVTSLERELREKVAAMKEKVYRELMALRAEVKMSLEAREAFEHLRAREEFLNDFIEEEDELFSPPSVH
ncbi:MAG: hypothetical protein AB1797_09035 [bacterium]